MAALEELFRDRFDVVADIIDNAPEPHSLYFVSPLIDKIGVGESATVIIKNPRGRGFGLTVFFDDQRIVGMRHLKFNAKKPPDAPGNRAFIEELTRRLQARGASLIECGGHVFSDGLHVKPLATTKAELEKHAY